MGVFIINPDIKQSFERLREYAEDEAHWYHPGPGAPIPGDNPKHVVKTGTITTVFTWTKQEDTVYRHATISTEGQDKYPDPRIAWTVAHFCGFTGGVLDEQGFVQQAAENWAFSPNPEEGCVVLVEEVKAQPNENEVLL